MGDRIITNIIDTAYGGMAYDFNIAANGIEFKTQGDPRDLWKPMNLSSVTLNMYLDTPMLFAFYDDISEAEEGRFFLEIRRIRSDDGNVREFVGMILTDGLQRQDTTYPLLKLDAIDGLAILKEVPFVWSGINFVKPLWEIFYDALSKNPVIEDIYAGGDVIAYFLSKIESNKAGWQTLFESVVHFDYFYTMSENQRTNWNCYQVIEELCNKYMLRVIYDDGAYYFLGAEVYYLGLGGLDVAKGVTKSKSYGSTTMLDVGLVDVSTIALDGGTYNAIKGYKQARIEASKEGSNKYLAQDKIFTYSDWDLTYKEIPPMIKSTEFELQLNISATILWELSFPEYGRVNRLQHVLKLVVKFTDLETNAVFYGEIFGLNIVDGDKDFAFKYVNTEKENLFYMGQETWGSYSKVLKLIFPSYAKDRKVEIKYSFEFYQNYAPIPFPGIHMRQYDYWMKLNLGASPLGETASAIPISAQIDATNNTGVYNKKIYSSDMYGAIGTKAMVLNSGLEVIGDNWRIGSSGSFEGLEKAITRFMIKQLVNSAKVLKLPIQTSPILFLFGWPKGYGEFTYKGKTYLISQIEQNYLEDVVVLTGIEKKTESAAAVTSNSVVVNRPPIESQAASIGSSSSMISRVNSSWIIKRIDITTGVTQIDIPEEMWVPVDAVMDSVYNSLMVMVDGVMWTMVQAFVEGDRRPRVRVDLANTKLHFNRTLQNTVVTLVYQNNVVKDPDYAIA